MARGFNRRKKNEDVNDSRSKGVAKHTEVTCVCVVYFQIILLLKISNHTSKLIEVTEVNGVCHD